MRGSFRLFFAFFLLAAPLAAELPWQPRGEELQANTYTALDQYQPDVATLSDGRTMVAWIDVLEGFRSRAFDREGQPLSPEVLIGRPFPFHGTNFTRAVRVAAGVDGFLVVWQSFDHLLASRFDGNGNPLGSPRILYPKEQDEFLFTPEVISDGAGGYLAAWAVARSGALNLETRVLVQHLNSLGAPLGGAFQVSQEIEGIRRDPRLALLSSGEALVTWIDERETLNPDVWARRITLAGGVLGPEFLVNTRTNGEAQGAAPVAHAGGGFSVVWSNLDLLQADHGLFVQRFNPTGQPIGQRALLSAALWESAPVVAADPSGNLLVLWAGVELDPDGGIMGRFFTPSWQPVGELFRVNTFTRWNQTDPALSTDGKGHFFAAWSSGEQPYIITPPPAEWGGQDGSSYGVFGQAFGAPRCGRGTAVLCLGEGGRFEVRVRWKNPFTGETGTGKALPLVADTGAMWFFQETNLELLIKVLDARLVNGHFWVYFGALSDVEYTVEVTDTVTRKTRTYDNPAGQLASRADIEAFKDGDAPSSSSALTKTAAVPLFTPKASDCQASAEGLCLNQGRFRVEVELIDPRDGKKKRGQAVPLTGDTGAFWFFGDTNLELLVKVLDGRGQNGSFWVYYGALSDVDYTITVTDTVTQETQTYRNPRGRLASRGDVDAFPVEGQP